VGLQITVEDRGPGVPYGDKRRIFEPFVSTQPGGTGLGLAIVAQIVNNHRGTVRETGIPGSGARFVIDLPAQTSQESPDGSDGNR
jgi:signal transduction histidine kinase